MGEASQVGYGLVDIDINLKIGESRGHELGAAFQLVCLTVEPVGDFQVASQSVELALRLVQIYLRVDGHFELVGFDATFQVVQRALRVACAEFESPAQGILDAVLKLVGGASCLAFELSGVRVQRDFQFVEILASEITHRLLDLTGVIGEFDGLFEFVVLDLLFECAVRHGVDIDADGQFVFVSAHRGCEFGLQFASEAPGVGHDIGADLAIDIQVFQHRASLYIEKARNVRAFY